MHDRPPLPRPEEIAALPPDGGERFNRLVHSTSPYLRQHAANPVDWYPWGEEAFARAAAEDRPIFLSIGYSTCHWCHVMERESFEDEGIAAVLNDRFVPVKVDREQRPDVDKVYIAAVQMLHGQAGWPLSLFLTPDRLPFFGATYLPPRDRGGRMGFLSLLERVEALWSRDRSRLVAEGERLAASLAPRPGRPEEGGIDTRLGRRARDQLAAAYDGGRGGFGGAPKFPRSHVLDLLLALDARQADPEAVAMVERTLTAMDRGGLHDHLGGGFHRYSTDAGWLLPHFEKMLYDQALLVTSCLAAWRVTGRERYRELVVDILDYVHRDLAHPEGGWLAAEDADSEGEEGRFYLWTPEQIEAVLGPEEGALFGRVYGVQEGGNFRDEATGRPDGRNILHLPAPLADLAAAEGQDAESLARRLAPLREALRREREKRVRPFRDDKVLTDWNGLMIAALADAGWGLGRPEWLAAARRSATFLLETLVVEGRLLHGWREGRGEVKGFLDDYAFLVWGLTGLHQATLEPRWLAAARELAGEMIRLFHDEEAGGFWFAGADGETLFSRSKELYDGAIPSGNSVATLALLRLAALTGEDRFAVPARRALAHFAPVLEHHPEGYPVMLMALDWQAGPVQEITLYGPDPAALHSALGRLHLPRTVIRHEPEPAPHGRGAQLCRTGLCLPPVDTLEELKAQLQAPV